MNKIPISCVIITYNEVTHLRKSLPLLTKYFDEVLLIDSGSTDGSEQLAQSYSAKVLQRTFDGYGPQKHWAVLQAKHDWILSLDADEYATDELINELRVMFSGTTPLNYQAYNLKIRNFFMATDMTPIFTEPNAHLRLFNRKFANFDLVKVHEKIQFEGATGILKNTISHYSYQDIDHYFQKFNRYTSLGAQEILAKNTKPISNLELLLRMPTKFLALYILKGYCFKGFPGLVWSFLSATYPVVKYMKYNELLLKQNSK
jgi:glycosyltransferase involved in cell wall biosynthesis